MPPGGVAHARRGAQHDADAVGEGEPVGFAAIVDGPDDLAGHALGPQIVVEGEVERDCMRAVLGEREVLVLFGADLDVGRLELHLFAVDDERERALLVEFAPDLAAVDVLECSLHAASQLAESRAERLEVRGDAIGEQAFEGFDDLELLDVQLVPDLLCDFGA